VFDSSKNSNQSAGIVSSRFQSTPTTSRYYFAPTCPRQLYLARSSARLLPNNRALISEPQRVALRSLKLCIWGLSRI
jgi:hypothetical protein